MREGDILNPEFAFLEGGEHNGGNKEQTDGGGREFTQRAERGGKEPRSPWKAAALLRFQHVKSGTSILKNSEKAGFFLGGLSHE